MNREVFIIHASQDGPIATQVVDRLEAQEIRGSIRSRDFSDDGGQKEAMMSALASSRIIIIIVSQAANDSRTVQNEVQSALESTKFLLPFKVGKVTPTGAMELLLHRRFSIEAGTAIESSLNELLRVLKPLTNREASNAKDAASISRTLPARSAILRDAATPFQVPREQMGPFQAAAHCPRVAEIDCPFQIELIIANQGTQILDSVEIELTSATLGRAEKQILTDLSPGTQARLEFELVATRPGPCVLRLSIHGRDTTMKSAYGGSLTFRVSDTPEATIASSRPRRGAESPRHSEPAEVTRESMTFRGGKEATLPPSITIPEGFEPLELTLDHAHSLEAEMVAADRVVLSIPFGFLGQRQNGKLLVLEPKDSAGALPHQEMRISARPKFVLGRSREESDFLLWFWPRNEIHDAKTLRISKKQCILSVEEGECLIQNSPGASVTSFEGEDVSATGVVLKTWGVLAFSSNYYLTVSHIVPTKSEGPQISNLAEWKGPLERSEPPMKGCVSFRAETAHVLPQSATWLFTEATFGTSRANPIVFNSPAMAEVQGRIHYLQNCFWIENCIDNGAVQVDNQNVKPVSIVPLVHGKALRLGDTHYSLRITA